MSLYKISRQGKFGFINIHGEEVIKPQFEGVYDFHDDLAWASISQNGKLMAGFINAEGQWIISPTFSGLGLSMFESIYFSQGLAPVQSVNGKMLFIDQQGTPVTDAIYDYAFPFSEGRALVARGKRYGYIDVSGKEIIPCQFGKAHTFSHQCRFSEGLALVRFGEDTDSFDDPDNLGYIDAAGEIVFEGQFTNASAFSEGFAAIRMPDTFGEYYFMDNEGEFPMDKGSLRATSFSEGLADIYDVGSELMGFIDAQGNWIIPPQFTDTQRFSEGLAAVKSIRSRKTGYIDTSGAMAIPSRFDIALPFKNGLALVEEKGKKGYINKSGEYIWRE